MSSTAFEQNAAAFRQHLPDLNTPRFQIAKHQDAYEYADAFKTKHQPPWLWELTQAWEKLLAEPYKGVTADGNIIPDLFPVEDQGIPIERIVAAVNEVLDKLTPEQKAKVSFPVNAKAWRAWSNPEILLRPLGLRLEELEEPVALSILGVMEATLSPEGYEKAVAAMRINHFLGEVCQLPRIMNKYSYNFLLFGHPSIGSAWGWSLYGHHLCLNVFLKGRQIVISPTFTGAEPNVIDSGPFAGTQILNVEDALGLQLMRSLSPAQQKQAQTFALLKDPHMLQSGNLTVDRWNPDDQRHLCGAFRDNRVVPYEGVCVAELTPPQQRLVLAIAEQFVLYLPTQARRQRLAQVEAHWPQTFFSWIGGYEQQDAFYYRVQSPVLVAEFDHHSGVFLANKQPARFHTHTILRSPNGGDYGCALRAEGEKLE